MTTNESEAAREYSHSATYCPEDNKLRLYPDWSDPAFDKEDAKALGFRWAGKQELYVAPTWTPQREDYLMDLCGEIGDESYSPEERAADRAERFGGYRDKRRAEATGHADAFDAGPAAFGHQNRRRAERAAARHDRHRGRACSQWSKAEYWQQRTAGVIAHALFKSSPEVRRGRIKRLTTEQRKELKSIEERKARREGWARVAEMSGADEVLPLCENGYAITAELNEAQRLAYSLANHAGWLHLEHPDSEEANAKALELHRRPGFSLYDLLTNTEYLGASFRQMTPREVARLYLEKIGEPGSGTDGRWVDHFENRLAYENAMLENEGGTAAAADIEPGGFFGKTQVLKVNKSPATGLVVSVGVWGPHPWRKDKDGRPEMGTQTVNIERLPQDAYRAPTDEERAAFKAEQAQRKAAAKKKRAANPAPKLINPTDKDAERLQAIWNGDKYTTRGDKPREVLRMTQSQYSARSKGTYASCETAEVSERLRRRVGYHHDQQRSGRVSVFKVRHHHGSVIIITDKPQKPLPFEKAAEILDTMPNEETHGPALVEFFAGRGSYGYEFGSVEDEAQREKLKQWRKDFGYLGWANITCANQCDLTDEGAAILEKWRAIVNPEPAMVTA